jgi:hypothetical protein
MRLRRLTEHFRTQNWTAVGLDFVIVVVGVFIGIQMSNWNEQRKEHAVQQLYLEQLVADLEQIEAQAVEDSRLYGERVLASSRTMEFLGGGRATPEDAMQFERDLGRVANGSPAIPRSPTIVELLSTGRMGTIGAPDLRLEIVRFDQLMQAAEGAAAVIVDVWREEGRSLFSKVSHVSEVSEDGRELVSSRAEYDLEAMRNDRALLPSLSSILYVHLMEVGWRNGIAERAADLRARLEEAR